MGRVSYEHQGRKIQMARMNNYTDAYVVNGWESELIENYSGIVDCFRYPKSTPQIIAQYNRPLYIAVMRRKQIIAAGDKVIFDFFLINEKDIKGEHILTVTMHDPSGREIERMVRPVTVSGGEIYGELLIGKSSLPVVAKEYAWGTCRTDHPGRSENNRRKRSAAGR